MDQPVYLAGAVRTAIGSFSGAFAEVPATKLGATVIAAALEKAGVDKAAVNEVVVGNVISAGLGQNVGRQSSIAAGLGDHVPAMTINKVCGSGLKAVMLGAQAILYTGARCVVAAGAENMTRAPYLLDKARGGYRMGDGVLIDSVIRDGLWDVYNDVHMGTCGDKCAAKNELSRQQQDDFAIESYKRALKAVADRAFKDEIVPYEITTRKGSVTVDTDEEPQRFNEEKLRALRPAFDKEGTVTAGNASSLNDGAAAVVALSEAAVSEMNITPLARIVGFAQHSRDPAWFTEAPIGAMDVLMQQLGWSVDDVDLFEINEAFSCVPMAAMKQLNIPHEKTNVHGGAVALGHPVGCSGTRVLVTLLHAMRQRQAKRGIASLCIGGGEGVAMAVERV